MPPTAQNVKNTFAPAFKEISRRQEAARCTGSEYSFAPSPDAAASEGIARDQVWALVTMGTDVLAPRPADPLRPALRVYGAFPTKEDAKEHAAIVRERDATCSLVLARVGQWILMPADDATRDDAALASQRVEERLAAYQDTLRRDAGIFEQRIQDNEDASYPTQRAEEDDDGMTEVYPPPRRIRGGAEVRNQGVVVLSVIPDVERGECLFRVASCLENHAAAEAWIRDVGSRALQDHHLRVAPTCEWVFPNGIFQDGTSHYRHPEMQKIMDASEQNPRIVRQFKEWEASTKEEGTSQEGQGAASDNARTPPASL